MTKAFADRVFALVEKNELEAAQALVDSVLAASDADAQAWYAQGLIQWQREAKSDAIASFNKAIKYKPDYKEACADLAKALEGVGQMPLAIKMYEYLFKLEQISPVPIVQNPVTPAAGKHHSYLVQ